MPKTEPEQDDSIRADPRGAEQIGSPKNCCKIFIKHEDSTR
ncbi:hypothetical protein ACVW0B_002215 [Thermostichus sp. MS-CIW-23]|jgi:hypothetical protein